VSRTQQHSQSWPQNFRHTSFTPLNKFTTAGSVCRDSLPTESPLSCLLSCPILCFDLLLLFTAFPLALYLKPQQRKESQLPASQQKLKFRFPVNIFFSLSPSVKKNKKL
jgi:hypothetical protein